MAAKKVPEPVNYYDGIIAAYERTFGKWESRADKIVKRYRDEQRAKQDNDQTKLNILWSNVNTLVPATYSKVPQVDVGRRFRDQDPVGRVSSLILERALSFEIEHYPDYRATMREGVLDRFLPGRGTAWARYEPHFKAAAQIPEDGLQVTEDTDDSPEQIDYECAPVDYVHWKDFGHNVARTWEEVFVVWRVVYMFEEGVKERFGEEIAGKLAYDATPEDKKKELTQQEVKKQARIFEIWDKQKKKVFWLSRSSKSMLDERDDPLGLQEFFPCPRPLYATTTNDTLIPVPDFALYQDQARQLDVLADRINGLIDMLKVRGCYDASTPELARLFTEGTNGTLIPVKNFAAFAERQGLKGSIDLVELKPIYEALKVCFESVREVMNLIYQITGISDIVRGQTEAGETLGAQQLKVNFVGLRLGDMKRDVARFATDLLQLKAQIMCQHYSPQTITSMAAVEQLAPADQQLVPQAMMLLLGEQRLQDPEAETPNPLRAFRIEVNADTLIQIDEQQEKESATELMGGLSRFLESGGQIAAGAPQMVPVLLELMKWALTKFKVAKNIEGTIDQALEQMEQAAQQPKPPDPETQKAQQQMQLEQAKLAQQKELEGAKLQSQQQLDAAKLQHEKELATAKLQADMQIQQQKLQADTMIKSQQLQHDKERAQAEMQLASSKQESDKEIQMHKIKTDADGKAMQSKRDMAIAGVKNPTSPKEDQAASEAKAQEEQRRAQMDAALSQALAQFAQAMQAFAQAQQQMAHVMSLPKRVVRGPDGKVAGMEMVR